MRLGKYLNINNEHVCIFSFRTIGSNNKTAEDINDWKW